MVKRLDAVIEAPVITGQFETAFDLKDGGLAARIDGECFQVSVENVLMELGGGL